MNKKEYIDHLQAYSLGCLNKDDFINFRNYIHSGEHYPWQELGEYQNLAALLPAVLSVEVPDSQLKDKVARKLYRIKDEVRAKRTAEISSIKAAPIVSKEEEFPSVSERKKFSFEKVSAINQPEPIPEPEVDEQKFEEPEAEPEQTPVEIEEEKNKDDVISRTPEFEIVTPNRKSSEYFKEEEQSENEDEHQPEIEAEAAEEIKTEEDDDFYGDSPHTYSKPEEVTMNRFKEKKSFNEDLPVSAKSSIAVTALIILILIVIAGGIYAYFSISSEVKTYQSKVGRLNEELQNLSTKTDDTKELQKMLEARDTRIVNLSSQANTGYGKLIFNSNQRQGYLQLGGMPSLLQGKAFQLWLNPAGNNFISLGVFTNSGAVEYYPVDFPELPSQNNIRVLLTEEDSGGAERPGRNVYLSGTL